MDSLYTHAIDVHPLPFIAPPALASARIRDHQKHFGAGRGHSRAHPKVVTVGPQPGG